MHDQPNRPATGYVFRVERQRGPQWYLKYRAQGQQVQKRLGPAWSGKGRPPAGYYTKRTAEAELRKTLGDADRGIGIAPRTGATFADVAEAWYRHGANEGGKRGEPWKPSTKRDYRSALDRHLLPAFGDRRIETITTATIEAWRADRMANGKLPRRTAQKLLAILHAIFERARRSYRLPTNPARDVERLAIVYRSEDFDFYSPEEVLALVRAAETEQDGAIYLTAAFTGLRMGELLALRIRDIDFEAEALRVFRSVDIREGVGTTKGGRGRTVPMIPEVATALARQLQRDRFTGRDDFAFPNEVGRYLDGSALRRRYKAAQKRAELRPLRFHDLRHSFGSIAVTRAESTRELQAWMGHADARTTERYTHYKARTGEARRLAGAFAVKPVLESVESADASDRSVTR